MKSWYVATLAATALVVVSCVSKVKDVEEYEAVVEEARRELVPDTRTEIFSIELRRDDAGLVVKGETGDAAVKEALLKRLGEEIPEELIDSVEVLPSEELGEERYGIVNLSVANMRPEPGHSGELITQSILGTPVKLYKTTGYWFYLQTPDEYLGWMDGEGVLPVTEEEYRAWIAAPKVIVTEPYGFCRERPSASAPVVSDIVAGNLLKLEGAEGGFYKVSFPDERVGYVSRSETEPFDAWLATRELTADAILETAHAYMGLPYLWGGTSVKANDCSGYTKTVYFLHGVLLPRDASQQILVGDPVDTENGYENLQPGDLLFFGRHATDERPQRVTHVGIYKGGLEFIHQSGRVKIQSFDPDAENYSEYRDRGFLGARRVIGADESSGIVFLEYSPHYVPKEEQ
jgi:hypothetical protein